MKEQRTIKAWPKGLWLVLGAGLVLIFGLGVLLLAKVVPLPDGFLSAGSPVVYFESKAPAHVFLSPDDKWRISIGLDDVDPAYVEALIRFEDKRFWGHPGVDMVALVRALGAQSLAPPGGVWGIDAHDAVGSNAGAEAADDRVETDRGVSGAPSGESIRKTPDPGGVPSVRALRQQCGGH